MAQLTLVQTVSQILNKMVTEKEAKEFANNHFIELFDYIKTIESKQCKLTDLYLVTSIKLIHGLIQYFKKEHNESINISLFDLNKLKEVDIVKLARIPKVGKRTVYDFIELLDEYSLNIHGYSSEFILRYQRYTEGKKQSFLYVEV